MSGDVIAPVRPRFGRREIVGKPLLVRVSHAVESFALACAGEPLAVIALFGHRAYYEREAPTYERIRDRASVTVVGVGSGTGVGLGEPAPHDPVLSLGPDVPVAGEWAVVVLGRACGASLSAIDLGSLDPCARSLEAGRQFSAQWSFRRADAYAETVRLRAALGPVLDPARSSRIDDVLAAAPDARGGGADEPADAALATLVGELSPALTRLGALARRVDAVLPNPAERDPESGLWSEGFLDRWTGNVPGSVRVGLALLALCPDDVRDQHGIDAEAALLEVLAGCLREVAGRPTDRVVRLGRREFLLTMPLRGDDFMLATAEHLHLALAELDGEYPYVTLRARIVVTVTDDRPLPLRRMRCAAREMTGPRGTVVLGRHDVRGSA